MPEKTAQKETGKKPKPQQEVIVHVPLSKLHDFPNHPFKVRDERAAEADVLHAEPRRAGAWVF